MVQMYAERERSDGRKGFNSKRRFSNKGNRIEYRKDIAKDITKVLVLDSSPKMEQGNTYLILRPFVEGMRSAGADVEIIQLYKLDIVPCTGEFHCWQKTPGECAHDDDMYILYPKMRNADIIVLVSPVYWMNINAKMKSVIDRMLPLIEPSIRIVNGRTRHLLRKGAKHAKVVLLSTCGDWEMDNFYHMTDYIREFCQCMSYEYCGELLRPHADIMRFMMDKGEDLGFIFDAARASGEYLIKEGCVGKDISDLVSKELIDREDYTMNIDNHIDNNISINDEE